MNIVDIFILIILGYAAFTGFRSGAVAQVCGLVGLIAGLWAAFTFSERVGEWLGYEDMSLTLSFVLLIIAAIIVLSIVAWITKQFLNVTGLRFIDRMGGLVLSVVKYGLVVSLVINLLLSLAVDLKVLRGSDVRESKLIEPLHAMADIVFPYIVEAKDAMVEKFDGFKEALPLEASEDATCKINEI